MKKRNWKRELLVYAGNYGLIVIEWQNLVGNYEFAKIMEK
jgi:hypothetical protein